MSVPALCIRQRGSAWDCNRMVRHRMSSGCICFGILHTFNRYESVASQYIIDVFSVCVHREHHGFDILCARKLQPEAKNPASTFHTDDIFGLLQESIHNDNITFIEKSSNGGAE